MKSFPCFLFLAALLIFGRQPAASAPAEAADNKEVSPSKNADKSDEGPKTIHAYVALCDNEHQSIIPVPKKIGKGDDPDNNLYWGCDDGIRGAFDKSKRWKLLHVAKNLSENVIERRVYQHVSGNFMLVADACRGEKIKECITHFLEAVAGKTHEEYKWKDEKTGKESAVPIASDASLLSYLGHNGLMEFEVPDMERADQVSRDCIVLGCVTRSYFAAHLQRAGARDLVMTTQLMCPAACILREAAEGWMIGEAPNEIRERAAAVYAKVQKCGIKGARALFEANR